MGDPPRGRTRKNLHPLQKSGLAPQIEKIIFTKNSALYGVFLCIIFVAGRGFVILSLTNHFLFVIPFRQLAEGVGSTFTATDVDSCLRRNDNKSEQMNGG
jgi:hypothetical protein